MRSFLQSLILTNLKNLRSVGKKLNKKDLLSTNLATKKGYCTQRSYMCNVRNRTVLCN